MKKLLFTGIIVSFLLSCTNRESETAQHAVIDIENGLQDLTRLKVSDFGKTIRYIPLETPDDGLVGDAPVIKVLKDYIVIEAQRSCLLFNKKDGSFISAIGHFGQDPEAYNSIFSWTDEKEEFLYFVRGANQLVKYDMKGNFGGKVEFPSPPGLASYYLLTDSEIIGYFNGLTQTNRLTFDGQTKQFVLGIFNTDGTLKDTIPALLPEKQIIADEIASVGVWRDINTYGNWAKSGIILIDYKNDNKEFNAPYAARLWKSGENIRFKEDFIDTIYTLSNRQLVPSFIFHTGKHHWPVQERTSKRNTNERIFISEIAENNAFVFFQCIRGLYSNEPVLYNGLYQKKTGETKLSQFSDAIEDDINGFMPFVPLGISASGEFVSIVEVYKILEWLEEHPEARNNEKLPFLKNLDEDSNPIVILVE